jgi:hypothetical protein
MSLLKGKKEDPSKDPEPSAKFIFKPASSIGREGYFKALKSYGSQGLSWEFETAGANH